MSCIWRKVAKLGEADWSAVFKKLFMILSPTCPRIAFRNGLCYALNSYLLEPNRFRVHPTLFVSAFCSFIGDEQARPLSLDSTGVYPLWASFLLFILGDRRGAIWEAVSLTLQSSLCRKVLNSKFGPRNCQKWVIRGPEQGTITTGNVRFAILEVVE